MTHTTHDAQRAILGRPELAAPFAGAVLAIPLLGERIGPHEILAGTLMAFGVWRLASASAQTPTSGERQLGPTYS